MLRFSSLHLFWEINMEKASHQASLIRILRAAYSGEMAAACAYRGHWKSVSNTGERKRIRRIEMEEWVHRRRVGVMLESLGSKPSRLREARMLMIGCTIAVSCHLIGWFLPMYFAGRIESRNVQEYLDAAFHAGALGLKDFESELLVMARVEKKHEKFFMNIIIGHRLLPITQKFFHWGPGNQ
jgi:rubrerythrin